MKLWAGKSVEKECGKGPLCLQVSWFWKVCEEDEEHHDQKIQYTVPDTFYSDHFVQFNFEWMSYFIKLTKLNTCGKKIIVKYTLVNYFNIEYMTIYT